MQGLKKEKAKLYKDLTAVVNQDSVTKSDGTAILCIFNGGGVANWVDRYPFFEFGLTAQHLLSIVNERGPEGDLDPAHLQKRFISPCRADCPHPEADVAVAVVTEQTRMLTAINAARDRGYARTQELLDTGRITTEDSLRRRLIVGDAHEI